MKVSGSGSSRKVCRPPDADGTCLGELLAVCRLGLSLGGGCAVGNKHDLALAPDWHINLLALLAVSNLLVGWLAPVGLAPADLDH